MGKCAKCGRMTFTGCIVCEPQEPSNPLNAISQWFVAYRDPNSCLIDHEHGWKLMGSAPTKPFDTYEQAKTAAVELANTMYYDVMVVGAPFSLKQ